MLRVFWRAKSLARLVHCGFGLHFRELAGLSGLLRLPGDTPSHCLSAGLAYGRSGRSFGGPPRREAPPSCSTAPTRLLTTSWALWRCCTPLLPLDILSEEVFPEGSATAAPQKPSTLRCRGVTHSRLAELNIDLVNNVFLLFCGRPRRAETRFRLHQFTVKKSIVSWVRMFLVPTFGKIAAFGIAVTSSLFMLRCKRYVTAFRSRYSILSDHCQGLGLCLGFEGHFMGIGK